MSYEPEDPIWQQLSRALFGGRKTADESLFTFGVMQRIRALHPDVAWTLFLRWAVPLLGASAAVSILATRAPTPIVRPTLETALFQQQASDEDPLSPVLEEFR